MIKNVSFQASKSSGEVGAILMRPADARWLLVFAHGAGAGMQSDFMDAMARELAELRVATFRYQFPYMERGKKSPDPGPILKTTVQSAVTVAMEAAPDLPVFAGGKSLGGRMSSMASLPQRVKGLIFFGFPLHAPGKPSIERADHLADVRVPMLFLQGTRDAFAELNLLKPVIAGLGDKATAHFFEGGDHSFHMLKSSGIDDAAVLKQLARTADEWASGLI